MARRRKEKRKKILLVDDNHETLEIIDHLIKLRDDRIDVVGSPSAEEGMLGLSGIDLLVTDLRLPGMGGVDLIKRARRRNKELPAIIISGLDEPEAKKQIGDVEIVAFVAKPYKPDELINLILQAVWGDDAPLPPAKPDAASAVPVESDIATPRSDVFHPPLSTEVISRLEQLKSRTQAHQVILWSLDGTLLYVFDEKERRGVEKLGKLAITSITSGLEMLVRSGSTPTRLMNVLDGDPYEIVLAYVKSKGDYCLAIVLDGGGKLGTVWGAVQRTVADLAIRLAPEEKLPAKPEAIVPKDILEDSIEEVLDIEPEKTIPEPQTPVVELNPIASDEDLELLIDGFMDEEISDDELDDFWNVTPSSESDDPAPAEEVASVEAKAEPVVEKSEPAQPELAEAAKTQQAQADEGEPDLEIADIPGLEAILVEGGEIVDERWEEVKGLLGLDSAADEFWEQAVAENLEAAAKDSAGKPSGIMSYEEAKAKGLLGD
ncbi:MAG: response regulator [Anaerolineae bacterium]